jgi:hypothetical protein
MEQPANNSEALELISIHRARLHELKKQEALFGATVDPSVPIQIREIERKIAELQPQAGQAVSAFGVPAFLMTTAGAAPAPAPVIAGPGPPQDLGAAAGLVPAQQFQAAALALQGPALVLDPPPIQAWVGRRTETVAGLVPGVNGVTWFALNGTASRGKTFLTRLLADSLGGTINWVQFAGLSDDGACSLLERLCYALTNQLPPLRRDSWYQLACQALGAGSILVFDDLPNLAASPHFASRLPPFVRACAAASVKLLSSSLFAVPRSMLQELGALVGDRVAPPFTNKDAEEVLAAFGAPPDIITPTARLINVLMRQHPTLIVAACRYLQGLNWALANGGLQGLFQAVSTSDISAEVQQKLLTTVPDADTRELLYRVSIVTGTFTWDDIDVLAATPPPIGSARERLRTVLNSWIDQRPNGEWAPSGLLSQFGKNNLPAPVQRACHVALGDAIFARGKLNQHSAFLAITHYDQGGEFKKASMMLVLILKEALVHSEWVRDDPVLLYWTTTPIPSEIDINVRLMIRGLHIGLFYKLEKPADFLVADFNELLSEATPDDRWGVAGAVSMIIVAAGRKQPRQSGAWLRRFLQLPAPARQQRGGRRPRRGGERPPMELSDEYPLHMLVWMLVGGLKTPEDVRDWIDTVQALAPEVRNRAMKDDKSHLYCVVVSESLTGAEQEKPVEERNWPPIVALLTEFAERATAMRCEILWACFVRAKITVQAEFLRDVDGAVATATQASQVASIDAVVRFLIDGNIGRQLALAKRYADARFWLGRAVRLRAESVFAYERANVLLGASHAFGIDEPKLGVKYAVQATEVAEVAESYEGVPPIDRVRAWCERGVAEFLANGAAAAFASWDRAGEYLFTMTERGPFWREQMVLFGHLSGYLAKVAETGVPPTQTYDGDTYAPPERGVFMTTNPARIAFFNERHEASLWRVLGFYADAVGNAEIAAKWKERAATVGKRDSLLAIVAEAERENFPRVLREQGYAAALGVARRSGMAMVVSKADTDAGGLGLVPAADLPAAISRLSDRQRETAEEFGMIIGLVPSAVAVATLAIKGETREAAREHAGQLASACRAIGPTSFAPDQWALVAAVIERAYIQEWSSEQLAEWDRSFSGERRDSFSITIRLATCADTTPINAAAAMLSFLPRLCGCFPPGTAVHRELIVPFVVGYWTHAFEQSRFLFGRAMVVEAQLPLAVAAPEDERVVAVMRAICSGFTFSGSMPEETRKWMFG